MINKDKPATLSPQEIEAWEMQDKYKRKIQEYKYPVVLGSTQVDTFFVVQPDRTTINAITQIAQKGDINKVNELTINTCVLAGNLEKLEYDDALYYGLLQDLSDLGEVKKKI